MKYVVLAFEAPSVGSLINRELSFTVRSIGVAISKADIADVISANTGIPNVELIGGESVNGISTYRIDGKDTIYIVIDCFKVGLDSFGVLARMNIMR